MIRTGQPGILTNRPEQARAVFLRSLSESPIGRRGAARRRTIRARARERERERERERDPEMKLRTRAGPGVRARDLRRVVEAPHGRLQKHRWERIVENISPVETPTENRDISWRVAEMPCFAGPVKQRERGRGAAGGRERERESPGQCPGSHTAGPHVAPAQV
jgi:hypothetical protein